MILDAVTIQHFRGIVQPRVFAPLSPGINLFTGPNEAGKSTVLSAILRALFDRHHTESVRDDQPWGTRLGPRVVLELTARGTRYRITKQFLSDAEARLEHWQLDRWQPKATGREADDHIAKLAGGELASRGEAQPANWGLGQLLWAPQGVGPELNATNATLDRVRDSLSEALAAAPDPLGDVVQSRIAQVLTPKSRKPSAASEYGREVAARVKQLGELSTELDKVRAERAALDRTAERLDSATQEHAELATRLGVLRGELDAARSADHALSAWRQQRALLESDAKAAQARWDELSRAHESAMQLRQAIEQLAAERPRLAGQVMAAEQKHATAQAEVRQLESTRAQLAARLDQRRAEWANARRAELVRQTRERQQSDAQRLRQQIADSEAVAARRNDLQRQLATIHAPTDAQLGQMATLDRQIDSTRAKLQASSLSVAITPIVVARIEITADDDAPQQLTTADTVTTELKAAGRLVLDIPGFGVVQITNGSPDAQTARQQLAAFTQQRRELAGVFADVPLEQLYARADHRRSILAELAAIAPAPAIEPLRQQLAALNHQLATELPSTTAMDGDDSLFASAPAQTHADLAGLEQHVANDEVKCRQIDTSMKQAGQRLSEAARRLGEAREQIARHDATHAAKSDQLRLTLRDLPDEAQRQVELKQWRSAHQLARQMLDAYPPAPKPPSRTPAAIDRELQSTQAQLTKLERELGALEHDLARLGAAELFARETALRERIAPLEAQVQHDALYIQAVQLLAEVSDQVRIDLLDGVYAPIATRAEAMLHRIVAGRYAHVSLPGSGLWPPMLHSCSADQQVAAARLSFGTREQLAMIIRLALADHLASTQTDRPCVMLDDPLVNADETRQAAAVDLLNELGERCQVLLFTCHAQAYANLNASRFSL